jgi:hypothetical protein
MGRYAIQTIQNMSTLTLPKVANSGDFCVCMYTNRQLSQTDMDTKELLKIQDRIESEQQAKTPDAKYFEVLTRVHPLVAEELGFDAPSEEENRAFGESIGDWPAFPVSEINPNRGVVRVAS